MNARLFVRELQRRKIYQFTAGYAVVSWLLIQIATQVFPFLEIPNWAVRLVILLLTLIFPLALVMAWVFDITPQGIKRTGNITSSAAPTPPAQVNSVAVLPFEDVGQDKDACLTEGIHNDILSLLSNAANLKVVSRTSVLPFRGGKWGARDIGDQLGVAHILEGMVRRSGNRVRVNAQLIDVRKDTHVWSEIFDRTLNSPSTPDPFMVQTDLAERIAGALQAKLSPTQTAA